MFAVYSNTTAPAATSYMNAVYGSNGYPMLGTYDVGKNVSARSVVANTGALTLVTPVPVGWAARVASTSNDRMTSVATDSSGNVFGTGHYQAALTVYNADRTAGAALAFAGNQTYGFLAKYTSSGVVSWATRFAGTYGSGRGVAVDSSSNVFVVGAYTIAAMPLYNASGTVGATLPYGGISGEWDGFVAKYSSTGTLLWAARIASGTTDDEAYACAVDPSGNVFVAGQYGSTLTFYNTGGTTGATLVAGTSVWTVYLAKYSSAGAVVWAARIGNAGNPNTSTNSVATDSSGNVYTTGSYGAALTLYNTGGTTGATLPFAGTYDGFVVKYTSAGVVSWAARIGNAGTTFMGGIAVDSSSNVFVVGQYSVALTLYNTGGTTGATLPFAGAGSDAFLAKYSSTGVLLWASQIAAATDTSAGGVSVDSNGNVFVCGSYSAALTIYNTGGATGATLPSAGSYDVFIAKYSSAGTVSWAAEVGGTTDEFGYGSATDSSGNVFVSGSYSSTTLTLYNTGGTTGATLAQAGGGDAFIAKYSPNGYIALSVTPASSNVLVSATYTPSTFSPFVNGNPATTLAGTTLTTTGLYLGGPSNYFNGSISEVLVFGTTLTNTQRQSMEGYLSRKWGITLPTTHPFYGTLPFNRYFNPTDLPGCSLWLDAADNSTMNSTTTVTVWNDKSGLSNTMSGTATWSGSNMTFNGSTQAFSNAAYVFPSKAFSMFGVYSNTTAPAATAYMNVIYGNGGFPMLGVYDVNKYVSARSVVANTGALGVSPPVGWAANVTASTSNQMYGITCDTSGNIYATGYYAAGSTTFSNIDGTAGATLTTPGGNYACYIVKYTSSGFVSWATQLTTTTTSAVFGYGITIDTSGNLCVAGYYSGPLTLSNVGGTVGGTLPTSSTPSCFIAKYTSAGAKIWAAQLSNAIQTLGKGIAVDTSGNVFVTGMYSGGVLTLYNTGGTTGATLPSAGGIDCFVVKYTSAGAVSWAAQIGSTGNDYGNGIATDSSGNVFVTGYYGAALTLYNTGGGTGATLANAGSNDCFVVKYTSAGAVSWAAQIASINSDAGNGIATDSNGNVFVTGQYSNALTLYNGSGISNAALANPGGADVFLAKYTSTGAVSWAARITSSNVDSGFGIATDTSGNVFVTGYYGAALTLYNTDGTTGATLTGPSVSLASEAFVAKYTSAGAVSWAARIGGDNVSSKSPVGNCIAIDPSSGAVFAGGYETSPTTTFYGTDGTVGMTISLTGNVGAFIAKYSPNGYIANAPVPASSNVLVSATYTPSTFSPFVNGSTATTLAGTTLAATGIFVGGPSNYFNGSISELLIYSSTLSAAQRQQVEGYLIQKWRLSSQTVAGHQYKLIPPAVSQPPQYAEVTYGNWVRDWNPYLQSLVTSNKSGVTLTGSHITGSATFTTNGWFGGVVGPDGNIYFTPFSALNILKLTVATGATSNITGGATYTASGWRGGVLAPDGNIYFTPFGATNILKLNVATGVTTNITGGATYTANGWIGAAIGPDGNMYCMPFAATNILKLNIATGVTTNITGGATYTASGWAGTILGPDGNIYGTPYNATNVLKLNVASGVTTNITGGATYTSSGWQGQTLGQDGCIYFAPTIATNVLKLNVATGVTTNVTGGATLSANNTRQNVLGADGNIYFTPHVGSFVLQLNVSTGVITSLTPTGITYNGSGAWQGALLGPDGNIYFSPWAALNILKLTFSGLTQKPSLSYCLTAYTNKY